MNLIASKNPMEEDAGVRKSGTVTAALTTPGKSRKSGKFYAVVGERALELYENEKSYRKKKTAKHLIDLATAFNVHKNYVDPKLKSCVCVMGPDETLLLKGDSGEQTEDWFDAILASVIPARALHLGRPIQHSEFFECAWDVELVSEPKFKGKRSPADTDDVDLCSTKVAKLEPGVRRLCYYPHTIIICKKKIEPATQNLPPSGIPPFSMDTFLEIPRMFIASFESQGAYFIIKMGRGSPTGAGNIFLQCDSEEIAADAHMKLRAIIDRELEKKKKAHGGNIVTGLTPARTHPRERSHTQPLHMRTNNNGQRICSPAQSTSMIGRKSSNCSTSSRCGSMSYGASTGSPMQMKSARDNVVPEGSFWAPFSCRRLSNTSSIKEEDGYQPMAATSRSMKTTSYSTAEETEDSGGTLRLENGSYCDPHGSTRSSQRSLIVTAEIPVEAVNKVSRGSEVEDGELDEGSSVGGVSGSGVSGASCGSADMNAHDTYTPMEAADWNYGSNPHLMVSGPHDTEFHLEEVRSFISDSSDSCYSSMAAQSANGQFCMSQPRAYSFAGRTTKKPVTLQPRCATGTSTTEAPIVNAYSQYVDPRKRAFSLGSKNLLPPFRKNSAARQARQSQTSTSGVSISSAEYPMDPPSSSLSSNHLATTGENEEYSRDRSGSFGSGRSTPYTTYSRRPGPLGVGDHLFEIDFSDLSKVDSSSILAKGGSGSIASIDSPSRSRTSSFGCNVRKEDMMIPMSSSFSNASTMDSVRKQLQSQMLSNKRRSIEDGDYVITEPPKVDVQRVECLTPDSTVEQMKSLDLRKSQVIETIEETTSEKSSRSGSRISLVGLNDAGGKDDDYTVMECSSSNGHSSDNSTKKKEEPIQTRPDRSTSNPVKEELAVPPATIPKRSSVPSMSSSESCKDDANLNYACLKMHEDNGSATAGVFLTAGPSRIRSKSGILFSEERSAPNALDYATFKPR